MHTHARDKTYTESINKKARGIEALQMCTTSHCGYLIETEIIVWQEKPERLAQTLFHEPLVVR